MEEPVKQQPKPKRRHIYKAGICLVVVSVVFIVLIIVLGQRQAVGKVLVSQQKTAVHSTSQEFAETRGEYVSFTHPESYTLVPERQQQSISIEQFILTDESYSSSVKLSVAVYPFKSLDQTPGYQLRNTKPKQYSKSVYESAIVFTDHEHPEKVAFVRQGQYIASVALTMSSDETLPATFEQIIASVVWLK